MTTIGVADPGVGQFLSQSASVERKLEVAEARTKGKEQSDEELKSASEQFEALLLNFMIREMRATVPEGSLFPRSMAEEMFTSMLDEKIAGKMADRGGIGISRLIFDQLKAK